MARTLIAYVSVSHGNTAKLAHAIGEVLLADLMEPELVDPAQLSSYDMLGVGSGIYGSRPHPRLRGFVQRLPAGDGMAAFTFTSSGFGRAQSRPWEASLETLLRDRGYEVVGSFDCRGLDTWLPLRLIGGINKGHPNADDLAHAREFARDLATQVDARVPNA
jgi:flavodoxin